MLGEWKYKYDALCAGIENKELIENAEKLVKTAIEISATSAISFHECFHALLRAISLKRDLDKSASNLESDIQVIEEKLARFLCQLDSHNPDDLEPGNAPYDDDIEIIDGTVKGGPAFYLWRSYVNQAKAITNFLKDNKS